MDGRRIVIIDGDTIDVRGERIRILNIDAPESFRSRCEAELKLALRTKERLAELLRSGAAQIDREGQDRYRRTLATLSVREGDVGECKSSSPCPGRKDAKGKKKGSACGAEPRVRSRNCQSARAGLATGSGLN